MKNSSKQVLLLGAHISIGKGFSHALTVGQSINCTTIQIFVKSNRQWKAKPIDPQSAQDFIQAQSQSSIRSVVAHASYLINLATNDIHSARQSIEATITELDRCHQLNIPYLVIHPGSAGTQNQQAALDTLICNIDIVLTMTKSSTMLVLETMAGQGTSVCSSLEQLAYIFKHVPKKLHKRLGICVDICHLFAAGYIFNTPETYHAFWKNFDHLLGLEKLHVIHMNDSQKGLGCRVDRHQNIGKGQVGITAFELLMNDKKLFDIPKILETPYETPQDYIPNLETLVGLIAPKTRSLLISPFWS